MVFANVYPLISCALFNGTILPNQSITYRLDFVQNADCTGVLWQNISNVRTNATGCTTIELNITNLSSKPNYLCEYRNGTLRKTHMVPDGIFERIFVTEVQVVSLMNVTGRMLFNGSMVCTNANGLCNGTNITTSLTFNQSGWSFTSTTLFNNTAGVNVGIGTNLPVAKLSVNGNLTVATLAPASLNPLCRDTNNALANCLSSSKYQQEIINLTEANHTRILDDIVNTEIVSFKSNLSNPVNQTRYGIIAEQAPSSIRFMEVNEDNNIDFLSAMLGYTWAAIKALDNRTRPFWQNNITLAMTGGWGSSNGTGSAGNNSDAVGLRNLSRQEVNSSAADFNFVGSVSLNGSEVCTASNGLCAGVGSGITDTSYFQPRYDGRRWRFAHGLGVTATTLTSVGMNTLAQTGTGTADRNSDDAFFVGYRLKANFTGPVFNETGGVFGPYTETIFKNQPFMDGEIRMDNNTACQIWIWGLANESINRSNLAGIGVNNENGTGRGPYETASMGATGAWFRYRNEDCTGVGAAPFNDQNWQTCWGNGTRGVCFNTSVAVNAVAQYNLSLNVTGYNASGFQLQYWFNYPKGIVYNRTMNYSVRYNSTKGPLANCRSLNSSAGRTCRISNIYLESKG